MSDALQRIIRAACLENIEVPGGDVLLRNELAYAVYRRQLEDANPSAKVKFLKAVEDILATEPREKWSRLFDDMREMIILLEDVNFVEP